MFPLSTVAFKNKVQLLLWSGVRAADNQAWHFTLVAFNFPITIAEQTVFLWMLWVHEMTPTDCLSMDFKFHEIQSISARWNIGTSKHCRNKFQVSAFSFGHKNSVLLRFTYLALLPINLASLAPKWEQSHKDVTPGVALHKQTLEKNLSVKNTAWIVHL